MLLRIPCGASYYLSLLLTENTYSFLTFYSSHYPIYHSNICLFLPHCFSLNSRTIPLSLCILLFSASYYLSLAAKNSYLSPPSNSCCLVPYIPTTSKSNQSTNSLFLSSFPSRSISIFLLPERNVKTPETGISEADSTDNNIACI